ncbi:MAG: preprotein translocase subunit YajC [Dethiobacteria bacterium]|jgi:preprotein translocase subunit YajC|nr:preprotein translocase subunit YajC [Bacillota bacterium]
MEQLAGLGFLPIILLFVLFYFMLIRPQQKQQKQRQEMINNLKKGDRVITIGGIHGLITDISENEVTLRVADNVNIKFNKNGVGQVINDEE